MIKSARLLMEMRHLLHSDHLHQQLPRDRRNFPFHQLSKTGTDLTDEKKEGTASGKQIHQVAEISTKSHMTATLTSLTSFGADLITRLGLTTTAEVDGCPKDGCRTFKEQ